MSASRQKQSIRDIFLSYSLEVSLQLKFLHTDYLTHLHLDMTKFITHHVNNLLAAPKSKKLHLQYQRESHRLEGTFGDHLDQPLLPRQGHLEQVT